MNAILFWIIAALMLGFGCVVIAHRNPVSSALSLVMSFLALAALFISLDAYFIGVIQVLVYAGAVMVLFLFIIMLLDLKAERLRKINFIAAIGGAAITGAFVVQLVAVLDRLPFGDRPFTPLPEGRLDDARNIGMALFERYNLPLQIVGALVLVATVGVVLLSKKELK